MQHQQILCVCVVIPGLHTNYHGAQITEEARAEMDVFWMHVS